MGSRLSELQLITCTLGLCYHNERAGPKFLCWGTSTRWFSPKHFLYSHWENTTGKLTASLWKGPTGACSSLSYTAQYQKETVMSSARLHLEPKVIKQPTCLHPPVFVPLRALGRGAVLLERLVAEEIVTQEAATELLQEAQDIPDAVHYQQALEMLLPLKRS